MRIAKLISTRSQVPQHELVEVATEMAEMAQGNIVEGRRVLILLSRSLNVLTGGSHRELFCSRAYRNGWAICWYIDVLFRTCSAGDREHCRACFLADKRAGRIR